MAFRNILLATAASTAIVFPAFAQDAAPPVEQVENLEIVVTAQRRAESVQDVPIPVTIVSADQLQAQSVNEIGDLGRVASSLKMAENPGGSGGGGYIRGVGTFSRSRGAEPSVGIVVDGVVQGLTNNRNLTDIARVEVLRGPQGTLFGQSVSAGVINITTVAPNVHDFGGEVSTDLSFDDFAGSEFGKQLVRGVVNIPIAGVAGLRVTGYGAWTQGILENIWQNDDDYRDEWGIRGRFLANVTDDIRVNLAAEYSDEKRGNGYFLTMRGLGNVTTAPGATAGAPRVITNPFRPYTAPTNGNTSTAARVAYCGLTPSIDNYEICSDAFSQQTYERLGFSGQLDFDLPGGFSFTSITAYRELSSTTYNDIDNLPEAINTTSVQSGVVSDYDQFTQEVRIASDPRKPFTFTVGGFYFDSNVYSVTGDVIGQAIKAYPQRAALAVDACITNPTLAACTFFIQPGKFNNFQHWRAQNLSAFGEARYDAGAVAVFAGARINQARVEFDGVTTNLNTNVTRTARLKSDDNQMTWRVGAEYKPGRDFMLYGTVSRGYKNAQYSPLQNNDNAAYVAPEVPTSYELGLKSGWMGGRLLVNLSAFYMDVKGYQSARCAVDITNATTCSPFNIEGIKSKGIEGDIFGRIGSNLRLNANFIYNVIEYPNGFLAQDGTDLSGQQLQDAPRFSAALYADYDIRLSDRVDGFIGFDMQYKAKERLADLSASDYYIYKGHALFGARIGVKMNDAWRVAIYAQNIFGQTSPQQFATLANQDGTQNPAHVQGVFNGERGLRRVGLQTSLKF